MQKLARALEGARSSGRFQARTCIGLSLPQIFNRVIGKYSKRDQREGEIVLEGSHVIDTLCSCPLPAVEPAKAL